ncbi:helix-turn-helix domain-containing protein [Ensifer canadensis]
MLAHSAHAKRVYAYADQRSAAARSPIVASWRRCMAVHRLAPEHKRAPLRVTEDEFKLALDEGGELLAHASDDLGRLHSMLGRAGYCVLLANSNGVAIDRRGTPGDDRTFCGLGLWTGAVWTEASVGTNGIGTAIADERAVTVFRDQHFLCSNVGLSCVSAPIRDYKGRLIAVLDVPTCRDDVGEEMVSILSQTVRDAALRIELALFRTAFNGARFIMLPNGPSPSAILAVDRNDLVVGATRGARLALALNDKRIEAGFPAADALQETAASGGEDFGDSERAVLLRALARTDGNVSSAANSLGISRATLNRKLKKFHLRG